VVVAPVPVAPSPKFQFVVYGVVPHVVADVKVTGELTIGLDGRNVKLVDSGGGAMTATVFELVAICDGEDESVAVSMTVYD